MAETVPEFKWDDSSATYRKRLYDWENWFDGQSWKLVRGEDFSTDVVAFRRYLYTVAHTKKVRVRTKVVGDDALMVAAFPRDNEEVEVVASA